MLPTAQTPNRRGRSASAAPSQAQSNGITHTQDGSEQLVTATEPVEDIVSDVEKITEEIKAPNKSRVKRPRTSNLGAADGELQNLRASTRTLRTRAKTPTNDAPTPVKALGSSRTAKRETTPVAKKPRLVAIPKPPKIGMNPLPKPFGSTRNFPNFTFQPPYTLPDEVDPTRSGKEKLAVMIFGSGEMGQLGLGAGEAISEIQRPKLHSWFQQHLHQPTVDPSVNGEGGSGKARSMLGEYGVEDLVCGGMHTLVIDSNGTVWSWGINDNGVLGRNVNDLTLGTTEELESTPYPITALVEEGFRAVRVAAGDNISLAISDQGELRAWGNFRSNEGPLGFSSKPGAAAIQYLPVSLDAFRNVPVSQVACGADHVLALTTEGHVYSHGNGQQGQLGRKIIERRKINALTPERLALKNIVLVGSGLFHSFAVDNKGAVYAWGENSHRQTGVADHDGGSHPIIHTPTPIAALDPKSHNGAKVVSISAGEHSSLFLFDNGEVYGCGRCDENQIGLGKEHPLMQKLQVSISSAKAQQNTNIAAEKARLIASGIDEMTALVNAAEMVAQTNPLPLRCIDEPTRISFPESQLVPGQNTNIVRIACGTRHAMAVSATGEVYGWGYANQCQLGMGDEEEIEVPTRIRSKDLKEYKVLIASTGGQHSAFLAAHKGETVPVVTT